tara:strand:+ start:329 stop:1630 length:1302 start_codon:yes stop_codon:yes gene_type:complete
MPSRKIGLVLAFIFLMSMLSGCTNNEDDTVSYTEEDWNIINDEKKILENEIIQLHNQIDDLNIFLQGLLNMNNQTLNEAFTTIDNLNNQIEFLQKIINDSTVESQHEKESLLEQISILRFELDLILSQYELTGQSVYFSQNPPTFIEYDVYNHSGPYMNHANWRGGLWDRVTLDEDGIPKVQYYFGLEYVPTTAFHWGLVSISKYLTTGEQDFLNNSLNVSRWAVANQSENGGWLWPFSYGFSGGVLGVMEENWYGAMTQGLGMSFLTRMYDITGNQTYLDVAENATKLFNVSVENGGFLRYYGENPWYEEYPTPEGGSFVLNGYIYSLIGLYDLYATTGLNVSKKLYDDGVNSLINMISIFDLGCSTAYDLVHHSIISSAPNIANYMYHGLHISLLSIINSIEPGDPFKSIQERWSGYSNGVCFNSPNRANQ